MEMFFSFTCTAGFIAAIVFVIRLIKKKGQHSVLYLIASLVVCFGSVMLIPSDSSNTADVSNPPSRIQAEQTVSPAPSQNSLPELPPSTSEPEVSPDPTPEPTQEQTQAPTQSPSQLESAPSSAPTPEPVRPSQPMSTSEPTPEPAPSPDSEPSIAPNPQSPSHIDDTTSFSNQQNNASNSGGGDNVGDESNFNTWNNPEQQKTSANYVLNTNTMKFHFPSCTSVPKIAPDNYAEFSGSRDEAIERGYDPCGICKP